MNQQLLFAQEIDVLSTEISNLQQLLNSKQEEIANLQNYQAKASDILKQLSDFIKILPDNVTNRFHENAIALFSKDVENNPELDSKLNSELEPSADIDTDKIEPSADIKENIEQVTPPVPVGLKLDDVPNSNEISSSPTAPTAPIEAETTAESHSTDNNLDTDLAIEPIKGLHNVYRTPSGDIIIGFKNKTLVEGWSEHLKDTMQICQDFSIVSGKERQTNHKFELHLLGVESDNLQSLIDAKINFKFSPQLLGSPGISEDTSDMANPQFLKAQSGLNNSQDASTAQKVTLNQLKAGDIVQTQHGEYRIIDLPAPEDTNEEIDTDSGEIKIDCICLKHNSSEDIIGQTVSIPLKLLSLVQPVTFNGFTVGQLVKINTYRQGEGNFGKVGQISGAGEDGCAVSIDGETKYFLNHELVAG
ncbi:MAG: hypothetical protein QNJ38_20915 [Prochloraceae cyanobacterium]|nr:hypothetical protein [Prochloraceae cyanobacterium]